MRIAQVNDIASVASTLTRALRDLGEDVDLVEPPKPFREVPRILRPVAVAGRIAGLAAAGLALRRGGYDIVHAHFARLALVGPLSGRPFVLHCHGTDVRGLARSAWRPVVLPILRAASLVYYATPDLAVDVRAVRPDAIFLPNPIETDLFAPRPPAATVRDLLVGVRLDPIKGASAIVRAVERVLAARPSTSVTVVDQGRLVSEIRRLVGDIAVVPRVAHEALPGLFQAHRVALGQLQVGAIGNYELEAMATGIPVVTRFAYQQAYPEQPPILQATDGDEAAAAILELLADEQRRGTIADAGRRWVVRHHDAAGIARRVLGDYRLIR